MTEQDLQQKIKKAFRVMDTNAPPEFNDVWAAAEREYSQSRRRYVTFGGIAAAVAVIAIATSSWQERELAADYDFLIADALLNSTGWTAPSDALMPQHQFDIYQEIPSLMESTDMQEGPLL